MEKQGNMQTSHIEHLRDIATAKAYALEEIDGPLDPINRLADD